METNDEAGRFGKEKGEVKTTLAKRSLIVSSPKLIIKTNNDWNNKQLPTYYLRIKEVP